MSKPDQRDAIFHDAVAFIGERDFVGQARIDIIGKPGTKPDRRRHEVPVLRGIR